MTKKQSADQKIDESFLNRRENARAEIKAMDKDTVHDEPERQAFFDAVYQNAKGDAAFVPWADLKAKDKLDQWLANDSGITFGEERKAIDVACGLGDNAEAIAKYGFETTAFDLAGEAIDWAKRRFPESAVTYQQADLFNLPPNWIGAYDLVHECYTLQALPPEMLERTARGIASLVKTGGTLLVFTRWRDNGSEVAGPPWPLEEKYLDIFQKLGFEKKNDDRFENQKGDRTIPHAFMEWVRS